jgi:polyisoprenoid-binding protein YceI
MAQTKQKWVFDFSHSKIGFSVRHFGITETDGYFRKFEGKISTEKNDFSDLDVELFIDVNSIDTNDEQRDGHLRSADFFDAEKYPLIHFKSTGLELIEQNVFKLHGMLTIKDKSNPVSLNLEHTGIVPKDPFGNTKAGFFIEGKINRKDWGIVWNAALDHGGFAVGDVVKITCPVQLLKVKPKEETIAADAV